MEMAFNINDPYAVHNKADSVLPDLDKFQRKPPCWTEGWFQAMNCLRLIGVE